MWLASQYTTVGILRKKMSFNSTLGRETRQYIVSLRKKMTFNSTLERETRHYIVSLSKKEFINDLPKPRTRLTFVHTQII